MAFQKIKYEYEHRAIHLLEELSCNHLHMDETYLINKVLSGDASETECEALEGWIAQSEANGIDFQNHKLLWEYEQALITKPEDDRYYYDGLHRIKGRIQNKARNRKQFKTYVWVSTVVVGMITIASLFFFYPRLSHSPHEYLKFDKTDLKSTIHSLEKEFDIQIEVENSEVLTCRVTGTFFRIDPPQEILLSLANALNLECEPLRDGKYILKGSGCLDVHP